MSRLLVSPPGAPLRKFPFVGRGVFPLSMVAIFREWVYDPEIVEDGARRLRIEDSFCDAERCCREREQW